MKKNTIKESTPTASLDKKRNNLDKHEEHNEYSFEKQLKAKNRFKEQQ